MSADPIPGHALSYRPEIDGLRAVAVLAVILFHAGVPGVPGGFVGVDVFFVISGYLITSILVKEIGAGTFRFADFYERRARRILPALLLVVACCIPPAWLWMLPPELKAFSGSVLAVCGFVSNILFWRESSYFDPTTALKPLLHTWSLAVEEQYYILCPVALLLLWRMGRSRVIAVLVLVALLSAGLSEVASRAAPSANFYLLPTRAWELMAGALCSFVSLPPWRVRDNVLSGAGLLAIALAIVAYDDRIAVPSVAALLPVLGACAILLCGRPGTLAGAFLSSRPLVGLGLVSYSAYLWHQPLFAFARLRALGEPPPATMGLLVLATLLLAVATWRVVEVPARRRQAWPMPTSRSVLGVLGGASVLLVAFGVAGYGSGGFPSASRFDARAQHYVRYLVGYDNSYFREDCFLASGRNAFALFKAERCLAVSDDKPNVLLLGDSHAAHLVQAIARAFPDVNVLQATSSGCRPLLPLRGERRCTDLMRFVLEDVLPRRRLDAIILSAKWELEDAQRLAGTLTALGPHAGAVTVIGPTMTYTTELPRILLALERGGGDLRQGASRFMVGDRWAVNDALRQASLQAGAAYVDLLATLCPDRSCRVLDPDGNPLLFDTGHFTKEGAEAVVRELRDTMGITAPPR